MASATQPAVPVGARWHLVREKATYDRNGTERRRAGFGGMFVARRTVRIRTGRIDAGRIAARRKRSRR